LTNQTAAIDRGIKAQRLLEDPLLREAFALAEQSILNLFRSAPDDATAIRSKQLLTALTLVKRALEQAISDGKIAEHALEDQKRGIVTQLGDIWRSRMPRSSK
jgi:hypothetical protein